MPPTGPRQHVDGQSRLWLAASRGQISAVARYLSAGARVDEANQNGATPLIVACEYGHVEVVRALLSAGARVDLLDVEGCSPLYIACEHGYVEVARALLSAGASPDQHPLITLTIIIIVKRRSGINPIPPTVKDQD